MRIRRILTLVTATGALLVTQSLQTASAVGVDLGGGLTF